MGLTTVHISSLLSTLYYWSFRTSFPSAVRQIISADEGVHVVLNVWEVEFHRCLDGDRLLAKRRLNGRPLVRTFSTLPPYARFL